MNINYQVSENNHYIKKTILEKWLIKSGKRSQFHVFNLSSNKIDMVGKNKSDELFTSLMIAKQQELLIDVNTIENSFEKSLDNVIKFNSTLGDKSLIQKIPLPRLLENEKQYIKNLYTSIPKYLALQLMRNPIDFYSHALFFRKQINQNSLYFNKLYSLSQENIISLFIKDTFTEPKIYKTLYYTYLQPLIEVTDVCIFRTYDNIFCLSDKNTCTFADLLTCSNVPLPTKHTYEKIFFTLTAPNVILLVNFNKTEMQENEAKLILDCLPALWNNFIAKNTLGKIILPNTNYSLNPQDYINIDIKPHESTTFFHNSQHLFDTINSKIKNNK